MKKLYTALLLVLLLCVTGTVVFLIVSPDQVPMHYNLAGEADRIGSKYENLLWPGFALLQGLFFVLMAKGAGKKGEKSNEKVLLITGVSVLAFFTFLGFYSMWTALHYDPAAVEVSYDDWNRFLNIGFGILLVVLGNIMPKVRRNSAFGLRTKWSLANDRVWQKSQRFGGFASVAAGFLLIFLAFLVPGIWNSLALLAVILVWVTLCVLASRRYGLEDRKEQQKKEAGGAD